MISKACIIGEFTKDIAKEYNFVSLLGKGGYGEVYRVQSLKTGYFYACKKINKSKIKKEERFTTELDLMKATDHPHIIKLFEVYEDEVFIYLIMEECRGGELFQRLAEKAQAGRIFTEGYVTKMFKQITLAVNYLHSHGVCHRDLKPENIVFVDNKDTSSIKLIDFGLSKIFSKGFGMRSVVGTMYYMAPEVLRGDYTEKCDTWSLGVMLFVLLSGQPPFFGKNNNETIKLISNYNYNFDSPGWSSVSAEAKDLVSSLLCSEEQRLSCEEILRHPWMQNRAQNQPLDVQFRNMHNYVQMNKIMKAVVSAVAFKLSSVEVTKLEEAFKEFDTDGNGALSYEEILEGISKIASKTELNSVDVTFETFFNEIDLDRNCSINYNEFIASAIDHKQSLKLENIREAFTLFDEDGDGKVSFEEIFDVLEPETEEDEEVIRASFKEIDANNSGSIDVQEFENFVALYLQSVKTD